MENIINVSDLKKLIATAHATLCVVIHALNTKILVGEINRPETPVEKKVRKKRTRKVKIGEPGMIVANILDSSLPAAGKVKKKRRTKKEIALTGTGDNIKMNLEKEYRAGRLPTLIPTLQEKDLPEDTDPFFAKAKKERKKKVPVVE